MATVCRRHAAAGITRMLIVIARKQVDLWQVLGDLRASFLASKDANLDAEPVKTRSVLFAITVDDQYLLGDSSSLRQLPKLWSRVRLQPLRLSPCIPRITSRHLALQQPLLLSLT